MATNYQSETHGLTLSSAPTLQKASLQTVDGTTETIECQFNPSELTITKETEWSVQGDSEGGNAMPGRNAPELEFGGGKPAQFSLDLWFDTAEAGVDVRLYTNKLLKLTLCRDSNGKKLPPPRVRFQWGKIVMFRAVITKVEISFVMFLADGTPVRARTKVDFIQLDPLDDRQGSTNPTSRTIPKKTRQVEMGERLDLIAYQEYGHSQHWRYLAEVNKIEDPKDLFPGQILVIPPLP
jgi:nucleoid-associated protein YgaU